MTGESEPRWDLLPLQPETFFGLEGDYDLRDLKRSYNTLIRRFKPEKFPEQFQRIRSAYEMLHDALRYGEEDNIPLHRAKTQFDWNASMRPRQRPPSFDRPEEQDEGQQHGPDSSDTQQDEELLPTAEQRPLFQRVTEEPPEALYRELRNRQPRTPFDYYALAVLSDVVEDDPLSFPRWLLQGLKEHPDEQGLFHLLREHFAFDLPPGTVVELLKSVSQIVRGDRFYYLTERLWERLLREAPFQTFCHTLEACEANLLDHQFDHQLTFYLRLLKPALWKADDSWLNETFAHVETHYERLSGWAEEELDFLDCLRTYQERRSEFVEGGGPMRAQIDRAIVNYCIDDGPAADRSFLECQQVLATNGEQLLSEFPVPAEGLEYVLILWERIADDVEQRVGEEPNDVDEEFRQRRVRGLAHRLMMEGEQRGFQLLYYVYIFIFLGWIVGVIGGLFGVGYRIVVDLRKAEFVDALWELLNLGGVLLVSLVVLAMLLWIDTWLPRRYYRSCWRNFIMMFFQSSRISLSDLADELERLTDEKVNEREIEKADAIAELLRKDAGMSFYAIAQRLMV